MSYVVWKSSTALSMRRRKQTQVLANMLWETKLAKSVEKLAEFCQIRQLCIFWTISKYFRLILEKSGWCQKFNLYTWQRFIGRVFLKMIFDITTVSSLSHRHLITVGKHLSSGHARFHLHKTSKVNFFPNHRFNNDIVCLNSSLPCYENSSFNWRWPKCCFTSSSVKMRSGEEREAAITKATREKPIAWQISFKLKEKSTITAGWKWKACAELRSENWKFVHRQFVRC